MIRVGQVVGVLLFAVGSPVRRPGMVGMNPPKRQVFVDSFSFEESNRRGTPKKSTTPRRATIKKPKANRKKAMPQPAAQPRKPKARVEPTPAEVEARQERQREYERRQVASGVGHRDA